VPSRESKRRIASANASNVRIDWKLLGLATAAIVAAGSSPPLEAVLLIVLAIAVCAFVAMQARISLLLLRELRSDIVHGRRK
jgi:hypothetical protein